VALDVLAQGRLMRAPERRTARNGKSYALAQMSVATEGGEDALVSVIVFAADAVERLLVLGAVNAARLFPILAEVIFPT
jgi:hypothetical protein